MNDAMMTTTARSPHGAVVSRLFGLSPGRTLRLALRLRRDRRLPRNARLPLLVAIACVLSPVQILPLRLRRLRHADNRLLAFVGRWLCVRPVPPNLLAKQLGRVEQRPRVSDATAWLTSGAE